MAHRIEIFSKILDTRAEVRKSKLSSIGFNEKINNLWLVDVYTIDADLMPEDLNEIASRLSNPVTQIHSVDKPLNPEEFSWALETGFLPGVTDNVGNTARQIIEDYLNKKGRNVPENLSVYSSQVTFLSGQLSKEDVNAIANLLINPLIHRAHIKSYEEFMRDNGMTVIVPSVKLENNPIVDVVDIIAASDEELVNIGKKGIMNKDGSRRGPLALDLTYMKTIQDYFRNIGRNPTDVELESIAQTWSEHCKHTIFADPIDDISDGLFSRFIKKATQDVMKNKSNFCVSVFKDNAGGILFDEKNILVAKVETHNTPSALDPFGGSITGIVGVDRDVIGFGLGAEPTDHLYGYCVGNPDDMRMLFRDAGLSQKMLVPKRIFQGIVEGVNSGGNCSGIRTPQGFVYVDDRYRGKPLVYVGTIGIIPKESAGRPSHIKKAQKGDLIVVIGGRVGKDGIHGATFSSEALDSGSPATAVQIGDPITQKKLSDAIVKEARDLGLYNSITDNGAGGLSCSVAEMAQESGGCFVRLEAVPLKYPGLKPWETWISESQERMTLAVSKEKLDDFLDLMRRRGVEATVIGEFTDSGKCVVMYNDKMVMDIDMKFLHSGLPKRPMNSSYTKIKHEEPEIHSKNITEQLLSMLSRYNITSIEFISMQYDHEVKGGSVLKPLQGKGRVNGDATVSRLILNSKKGVVLSQGINPSYSDIDTYHMAACAIDTALRNAISVGADPDSIALLDNFCWYSSNDPESLGRLKEACRACYDHAVVYNAPFISGKDSMFNDFKGYDEKGNNLVISVPPTLLVTAVGLINDVSKVVSLDAKQEGDFVYVIGNTYDELGGSEYFAMIGEQQRGKKFIGNNVPKVNASDNIKLYKVFSHCVEEGIVASAQSVNRGGLAIALAKTVLGGGLGLDVSIEKLPGNFSREDFALFSESQGRIVVTVSPRNAAMFEELLRGNSFAKIGVVRGDSSFIIKGKNGDEIVKADIKDMQSSYKKGFAGY